MDADLILQAGADLNGRACLTTVDGFDFENHCPLKYSVDRNPDRLKSRSNQFKLGVYEFLRQSEVPV